MPHPSSEPPSWVAIARHPASAPAAPAATPPATLLRAALEDKTLEVLELQGQHVTALTELRRAIADRDAIIRELRQEVVARAPRALGPMPHPAATLLVELQAETRELRGQQAADRKRLGDCSGALTARERELDDIRSHVAQLRDRSRALRTQLDGLVANEAAATAALRDTHAALLSASGQAHELAAQLRAAQDREAGAVAALDAQSSTMDQLNARMVNEADEAARLRATIALLQARHTSLSDAVADGQERVRALEALVEDGEARVAAATQATDRLAHLEAETNRLEHEVATQRGAAAHAAAAAEREAGALRSQVDRLRADLAAASGAWGVSLEDGQRGGDGGATLYDSIDGGAISALLAGEGSNGSGRGGGLLLPGPRGLQLQCESLSRSLLQREGRVAQLEAERGELLRLNAALRDAATTGRGGGSQSAPHTSDEYHAPDAAALPVLTDILRCEDAWASVRTLVTAAEELHDVLRGSEAGGAGMTRPTSVVGVDAHNRGDEQGRSPWLDGLDSGGSGGGVDGGASSTTVWGAPLSFAERFGVPPAAVLGTSAAANGSRQHLEAALALLRRPGWVDVGQLRRAAQRAAHLLAASKADVQEHAAVRLGQQCAHQ